MSKSTGVLRGLALKHKLLAGFGVVIVSMLAGTVFSVLEIRNLASFVSKAAAIQELTRIGTLAADMIGLERAIVLHSIFDDKTSVEQYKKRLDESSKTFSGALDAMSGSAASESTKQMIAGLRQKYASWLAIHNELIGYMDKQQVDVAEKKLADPSFTSAVDDMRKTADEMSEHEAQALKSEANAAMITSLIGFAALAVVSLSIGAIVFLYVRRVSSTLGALTNTLAGNSSEVESLSGEVQAASESVARKSSSQAASLEETAASSEQVTAMTRQNVESSQSAAAVMTEVDRHVKAGNLMLETMLVSMSEINASSEKISKVIKIIDRSRFRRTYSLSMQPLKLRGPVRPGWDSP
jgi:CHASE3 domain sensor protein